MLIKVLLFVWLPFLNIKKNEQIGVLKNCTHFLITVCGNSNQVSVNTSQNNSNFFLWKVSSDKQPKADQDYKLGAHTASNQTNKEKYDFY